jgi:hypothetical protein
MANGYMECNPKNGATRRSHNWELLPDGGHQCTDCGAMRENFEPGLSELRSAPMYRALSKLVKKHEKEQGEGCGLGDALANLRHIADELEQDFAAADRRGYGHYMHEKGIEHGPADNCAKCGASLADLAQACEDRTENGGLFRYCSEACKEAH